MPRLPAFCESCRAVFASPLRAAAPGNGNAFEIPVPCPACEGTGRIPGEVLEVCAEAARLFREAGGPEGEAFLAMLSGLADREDAPGEELVAETARRAPAFAELARRLPAGRPRVLEGFARLLRYVREEVGAAGGRAAADGDAADGERAAAGRGPRPGAEAAALEAVERLLEEEGVEPAPPDVPGDVARARGRLREAGRNDPCPCGSGDKYKDCHWMPDLRTTRT